MARTLNHMKCTMYLFPLSFSYLSDIFSPPSLSFSLPSASPSLSWPFPSLHLQQAVLLELQHVKKILDTLWVVYLVLQVSEAILRNQLNDDSSCTLGNQ